MTWICYVGIELSAKTQWFLLAAEIITLVLFAVIALVKVYSGDFADSVNPSLSWLNPFDVSSSALTAGVLARIFIYWGWDTAVAVNEETEDASRTPGIAGVTSVILLLGIYVTVSIAAIAVHGPQFLVDNQDEVLSPLGQDVLPAGLDKLLIIAVLTSAAASTQTTILPATRAALSMAAHGAAPKAFAAINPRRLTPGYATIWYGVDLDRLLRGADDREREHPRRLDHRHRADDHLLPRDHGRRLRHLLPQGDLQDRRTFVLAGLGPALGAILHGLDLRQVGDRPVRPGQLGHRRVAARHGAAAHDRACSALLLGIVLMVLQWRNDPAFFRRKPRGAPPRRCACERHDRARLRRVAVGQRGARARPIRVAKERDAQVVVVFGFYITPWGGTGEGSIRDAVAKVGEHALTRAVADLEDAGVAVSSRLVEGKPADALIAVAEDVGART